MRVAFDVTPMLGARTGVAQTVIEVLDALPDAAPAVELVPFVISARARRDRERLPVHTRFLPVPAAALLRSWSRLDVPSADRWLGDAEVVHGSNFVVPPMRRRPQTLTVHDCFCTRFPEACRAEVSLFTRTVQQAVDRGAWLHVSTEFSAAEVRELFGAERVAVVPFGVPRVASPDPAHLPPGLGGAPFVLSLGVLEPRKAVDALVRAFGLLGADGGHVDLRLAIAGPDGPARHDVEAAVRALPPAVGSRVVFVGPVSDDTRVALLAGASVLAVPSRYEGFGFPMLEAMALGTPVVAARAGALPEVAGDAAELVPVGDDTVLAAALDRVLTDDTLRRRLLDRGHARVATLSWANTAAGLAALWHRAATAHDGDGAR